MNFIQVFRLRILAVSIPSKHLDPVFRLHPKVDLIEFSFIIRLTGFTYELLKLN